MRIKWSEAGSIKQELTSALCFWCQLLNICWPKVLNAKLHQWHWSNIIGPFLLPISVTVLQHLKTHVLFGSCKNKKSIFILLIMIIRYPLMLDEDVYLLYCKILGYYNVLSTLKLSCGFWPGWGGGAYSKAKKSEQVPMMRNMVR